MSTSFILLLITGSAVGSLLTFLLGDARKRADLKSRLRDDDEAVRDLCVRSKRIRFSDGAGCVPVRQLLTSADRLLDMTAALMTKTAAEASVNLAVECETGVRTALGTVKGLLDCAEALVLPAAVEERRSAGALLARVKDMRRLAADRIDRCRLAGLPLESEAVRVGMLRNALEADELLVRSDPAQAVAVLARQIGVLNEILAEVELKEAGLPQA